ncbi:protein kintoun [Tribolium castaneum]|uniref:Protein kintoun n=1 Tax=Tribolium castaneum TaxID=7070 RepID=D6X0E6_TRICA|nr:PREDICTED: protein kintoun [Tribolium castaneum]EFA10532.1 Protein kintoun-like Protein [Tribolium castaneum]|eukprot:XP_969728.1 PREDICTED: protein kintoun [Tribolium castaneum]
MGTFEKLKELDLSRDEVERLGAALKKPEFRQLLADYVHEVQNPENRKLYEAEITQLERERGVAVTFINPSPGYVLKTSDGVRKCFINVCSCELIDRPTSAPMDKDGARGLQWRLPHSLTPPREDLDNKKARCEVYDVVFHPDVIHMAQKNHQFQEIVNKTACDAVEANFEVTLDKKNLKFPKLGYKGAPQSAIIRKPIKDFVPREMEETERQFYDKIYENADQKPKKTNVKRNVKKCAEGNSNYTTPKYVIKHRSHVDVQDCVEDKFARLNLTIPRELIVEINLPLLKASSDITLDVTEKTVQLTSEKPSKYKLNLTLPYRVNQDSGSAKFDKDLKKLIITLPVKRCELPRDDSGVESDPSPHSEDDVIEAKTPSFSDFRTNSCDYELPDFTCHLFDKTLAFTLNVRNVSQDSIEKQVTCDSLHLKFASLSSSFFESNYAFYVRIDSGLDPEKLSVETWDNNVVVQIPVNCDNLEYYYYGLSEHDLRKKYIEEPSVLNSVLQSPIPEEPEPEPEESVTPAINIANSYESSGDELSCSFSPRKGRGILKRLPNRSVSESSLDDMVASSIDDGEMSTSLKKTVRFNDVIMRQLYRSNSSILGQKKKNQRKARNKKRAQERRHSESEASEKEDEKREEKSDYIHSDIFDMDLGV